MVDYWECQFGIKHRIGGEIDLSFCGPKPVFPGFYVCVFLLFSIGKSFPTNSLFFFFLCFLRAFSFSFGSKGSYHSKPAINSEAKMLPLPGTWTEQLKCCLKKQEIDSKTCQGGDACRVLGREPKGSGYISFLTAFTTDFLRFAF